MSKRVKADPQMKKWNKWREKISDLSQQILKLQPEGEPSIIAVSKFLLTSQLVEFQLRELLLTLGFNEWLKSGIDYINDPADFDEKQYTLGALVKKELTKYTNEVGIKLLLKRLNNLVHQRNQFTHRLFGCHLPVEKLRPLSIKGSILGETILISMFRLERKMNDKQDKYLTRIKKLKNSTPKEEILRQIWIGKVESKNVK